MNINNDKILVNQGFSESELERYSRQIIIPEIGLVGQEKLKHSKVLVIGVGGLGSPIAMYLASAGVGKIGIIDFDDLNISNLQRQVIYSTEDAGKPKVELAGRRLNEINPQIDIEIFNFRLTSKNALDIFKDYDVIADGSDNFATRYLVNDACVLLKKPLVYGSILRFEGQASVFDSENGPCYRCLFPRPPAPGEVPSCSEAGVLGVLPGIIGSIQANEVIKLLLGTGDALVGRLLMFDALKMKFSEVVITKDTDCPVCGKNPSITHLLDYDEFCGYEKEKIMVNDWEITAEQLKKKMDKNENFRLIDIREPYETLISNIGGEPIPMNSIPSRIDDLNKEEEIILYCRTGHRSESAVLYLRKQGFKNAKHLLGGIYSWADKIDKTIKKY